MRKWSHGLAPASVVLLAALTVAGLRPATAHAHGRPPLRFGPAGVFKVALFADLHYGENAWTDWGPAQDAKSDRVMAAVLDAENPDFVVYLGDLVTANNLPIPNASLYWDRAISASRSRGVPWATVFGNHDDMPFEWPPEWFSPDGVPPLRCPASPPPSTPDSGCSFRGTPRTDLMAAETGANSRLSYSSSGPRELWPGVSNYVLQVLSRRRRTRAGDDHDPALLMYFLDSGGGSYTEVVSSAQVKWFHSQSQFLNPNGRIPELIFWHIPSTAYVKVGPKAKSEIRKPCVGSINKEEVAPQAAEWGIMDALAKRPSVKAVFVGHNHGLDWCCPYQELWLCFARHTGYGGYGGWPKGARIIEVTEDPFSAVSWIRMENGSRHSHVTLSS
ncbi:probable inactive purple acid phosphatase 16 [Sorghum bicolor]|uniref:Calcineurin-like phosphoesterase domain-containing protein n=1 Tax=Sorghum bicolor TaxID=4558 RepID=A0A1W0W1C8_SORBI|nr:probable inactive purple acid phosphatase 16 [Sorghum bicolor]OQU88186.1 hypothetical protein SORBI_3003G421800 [Sorghum bicolor]|eukprot:XP_021311471.1 probable inactive purple acid phosphatase 16 [Sorghum bicolor]